LEGTYEVVVCSTGCGGRESSLELARGVIVIEPNGYAASQLPEPARSYALGEGAALTLATAHGTPNACFVLRKGAGTRSLVGAAPVGFTTWSPVDSGGFVVKLAQTADAGYVVTVSLAGGRLRGVGRGWGPGPADAVAGDSVLGRRVGPPDRGACIRAAERAATVGAAFDSVDAAMAPVAPGPGQSRETRAAAGTYTVELCPVSCGARRGARSAVRGLLVVEDATYRFATLPEPVRRHVTRESGWLVLAAGGNVNACFVLERPRGGLTYAGSLPVGFTRWLRVDGGETMGAWLFRTAQAGYASRFAISGDSLRGEGRSVTRSPFDDPPPPDVIIGRRVGPPDRSLCVRAAERAARSVR
jgi:hypothetical protein